MAHPLIPLFQNQQVPRGKAAPSADLIFLSFCLLPDLELKILRYLVSSLMPSGSFKKYMWPRVSSFSQGGAGVGGVV